MKLVHRLWILVIAFGLALAAAPGDAQRPEGAMGTLPLPEVVGMAGPCDGFVLASGRLSSADHELADGVTTVGEAFTLTMRPDSPWFARVRELRDQPVEIVIRRIEPRTLQKVER